MSTPFAPDHETCWWAIDRFTAVEFPKRWDADDGGPLGEFLVGHVPRRVWLLGLALVKSSTLLGRCEFEVAHAHRRTEVGCCLP